MNKEDELRELTEGMDAKQAEELLNEVEEQRETIEAINQFVDEEDMGELSLKSILGGDILGSKFFLKQVMFVMYCVVLMLMYTANRYSSQQDAILIDELRAKLQDVKYNVMTQSSELMNFTRQSNVEKMLKATNDSTLHNPTTPPYLIREDGEYEEPVNETEEEEPEEEVTV